MNDRILPRASTYLWRCLVEEGVSFNERELEAYSLGKLSVLLDLETCARLVEDVRGVTLDDSLRFSVSSALRTVQASSQTSQSTTRIDDWYDELLRRYASSAVEVDEPPASSDAAPRSTSPPPADTDAPDLVGTEILDEEDLTPT